jgi:UDP-N-acetylglucosamine 3-dehydrogenase
LLDGYGVRTGKREEALGIRMRLAIIGAGTMGRLYAERIARIEGLMLAGVCDTKLAAACEVAALGSAPGFDSFERMLEEAEPDVLCICLPTHLHRDWTLRAAGAGLHVICEKPMASTLEEARHMMEACRAGGVRLFVAHVVRFFPDYADALGRIASGEIGEVRLASLRRAGPHPGLARGWYRDPAKSGGVTLDLMIHDLDYVLAALGEVHAVYGAETRGDGIHAAVATLHFSSGAIARVESVWGAPGPFRTDAEFVGTDGGIRLDSDAGAGPTERGCSRESEGTPRVEVPGLPSAYDPYEAELCHFAECIRTGAHSLVTDTDAYRALALALTVERSIRSGHVVKVEAFG